MSYRPRYVNGDWKAVCDVCGAELKASQLIKRWDGYMVCKNDWEPRHPQDFVRNTVDKQTVPWVRMEQEDSFIETDTIYSVESIPTSTFTL